MIKMNLFTNQKQTHDAEDKPVAPNGGWGVGGEG